MTSPFRSKTRTRRASAALAAVAATVLLVVSSAAAFAEEAAATGSEPKPPSISVIAARKGEIVERVDVTGTLMPRETVSVGADVDGLRIIGLSADEGDTVEKGEIIARLETDMIESNIDLNAAQIQRADAAIAQAKAQIADAQAAAKEADAALERSRPLAKKGIIGQDVLDQRIAAAASARARVSAAQQGIAVAEADKAAQIAQRDQWMLRKSKAEIKAPTAGLVLSRSAKVGAIVSAGSGSLFEIARDGLIELEAQVSETVLARLAKGQPVDVFVAGRRQPVTGEVRLIAPRVDQATRLGTVDIALPKDAEGLHAGAFARGVVEVARHQGVLVPRTAVVFEGDDAVVQVVDAAGVVEGRDVTLGLTTADTVEIRKGVAAGEQVVATAGAFVRDGDTVTPVKLAESGGEK
ncbi:efflux RND transporter periplasmic adaptor subunit [Jiella sonneratiae]|uniref:Efflux RND transporter periplasmic adaptor subunit n=1 Tax=Jiella sonneratiae TaxID=2816856 RepID=A0ABS3J994_9HYPH|nr:efflux RND transporter periplasmic adaptor subunit [Jiella sonneratiae]MBO0906230.1 efflux RND transporter periplasmic adaptor subunit [Jiella sonneratiae]